MQKKSNKNTSQDTLNRPLATKQPDSFIKNSVKNSISDVNFQKSSNYDHRSYDAHDYPYETIRPDAKSDLRPAPNDEYESESYYTSHQNNMQVESLGSRDVQNVADKALSSEELMRKHQTVTRPQKEDYKETAPVKGKGVSREVQAARDRLSTFNLGDLKITKKGVFDNRYNQTKEYLSQCGAAEVDPLDYYKQNFGELKPNTSFTEVKSRSQTQLGGSDHSNDEINESKTVSKKEAAPDGLYYNMDGSLDKRYKKNQIPLMIAEAKEKLSKIDVSKLKKTKDGKLDKRFKENKEYLELEKQCHEEYYQ